MSDASIDLDVVKRRFLEAERGLQSMIESIEALKSAEDSAAQTQQFAAVVLQEVDNVTRATRDLVLSLQPVSEQLTRLANDESVTSLQTIPALVAEASDKQAKRDAELRSLLQQHHSSLQGSMQSSLESTKTALHKNVVSKVQPIADGLEELRNTVTTHISARLGAIFTILVLNSLGLIIVLVLLEGRN